MAADRVFLDYDQAALDRAYEQVHWAPNMQELLERRGRDSEAVRARLGRPRTEAYGPSAIETLDIYATPSPNGPVFVFLHGGAWLRGTAAASAYPAEMFVKAGAHFVVPDFAPVSEVGLDGMVAQVRRAGAGGVRDDTSVCGAPRSSLGSGTTSGVV